MHPQWLEDAPVIAPTTPRDLSPDKKSLHEGWKIKRCVAIPVEDELNGATVTD
jgi:hypothetical protein